MAINLKNTRETSTNGVKCLVYGQAGAGKTRLCATLPAPIILSAEAGLLSLSGYDLPYIEIRSIADVEDAYKWLTSSDESRQFESVALDSLSEIAEVCLGAEKVTAKDPRQAYGALQDRMSDMIRKFRDLPGRNVYFSAKLEKSADEVGRMSYAPAMPGSKTGQSLPYFFDLVCALRVESSEGEVTRALQCHPDGQWTAKDRSGKLGKWEPPDMGDLIRKITQGAHK